MFYALALAYSCTLTLILTSVTNDTLFSMVIGVLAWASACEVRGRMYPAR